MERKKKSAKRELRIAQQQGFPTETIQLLALQFFSLVRSHRYAKEVLDGGSSSYITPAFNEEVALWKALTFGLHNGVGMLFVVSLLPDSCVAAEFEF